MALINCPECKKKVSEKAATCPSCGYAIAANIQEVRKKEKAEAKSALSGCLIFIIMIVGVVYWMMPSAEEPQAKVQEKIKVQEKVKLTAEQILYNKVKKIPAKQIAANRDGYEKLVKMNPNNDFYKKKYEHYNNLVLEKNNTASDTISISKSDMNIYDNRSQINNTSNYQSSQIAEYREYASKLEKAEAISIDRNGYKIYFETAYWNMMSYREKEILCTILFEAYPGYSLINKYSGKVLATPSMLGGVNMK